MNKNPQTQLLERLASYGMMWNWEESELNVRDPRKTQRMIAQQLNPMTSKHFPHINHWVALPHEIIPSRVEPYLLQMNSRNRRHKHLWSFATSLWSVPVTAGYGRRVRFFVFDKQNSKLIGVFGLCDPVIRLGARDRLIGWDAEQSQKRLYNCMTAYVLGAIPPYNAILGSKLVALSVLFPQVANVVREKYRNRPSIISGENKLSDLVYVDTMGAFGKSAIYTRLPSWKFRGYTTGSTHIHLSSVAWDIIRKCVSEDVFSRYKFGSQSNWKLAVVKNGLKQLALPQSILDVGWKRGYYSCGITKNWSEFLRGETNSVGRFIFNRDDLIQYWLNRWLLPRENHLAQKMYHQCMSFGSHQSTFSF